MDGAVLAAGASVAFGRGCPAGPPIPAPRLIAAGFDATDILATRASGQFIVRVEWVGGMEQFGVLALPPAVGVLAFHFHCRAPGQLPLPNVFDSTDAFPVLPDLKGSLNSGNSSVFISPSHPSG